MTRTRKHIPGFRAIPWVVGTAALLWGWSILDAPAGPGEPVAGMVIGEQHSVKGRSKVQIEMGDGTTVDKEGSAPVGSRVLCLRFERKYLPNTSYECR